MHGKFKNLMNEVTQQNGKECEQENKDEFVLVGHTYVDSGNIYEK